MAQHVNLSLALAASTSEFSEYLLLWDLLPEHAPAKAAGKSPGMWASALCAYALGLQGIFSF